jgi:pyruvate dehydrogenase (quinone)
VHLLNGLYDAKFHHAPVMAIVGQTNRSAMGGSSQQEVDLLSLYKDVASEVVTVLGGRETAARRQGTRSAGPQVRDR